MPKITPDNNPIKIFVYNGSLSSFTNTPIQMVLKVQHIIINRDTKAMAWASFLIEYQICFENQAFIII